MSRPARTAARIVLLDRAGRVLLFRFEPDDRPPFWCTPGGALEPGESYAEAARRELFEECGIDAEPGAEILQRYAEFTTIEGVPVRADERYFFIRTEVTDIDTRGHTALEQRVMTRWRWFAAAELAELAEPFFPEDLAGIIAAHIGDVHAR